MCSKFQELENSGCHVKRSASIYFGDFNANMIESSLIPSTTICTLNNKVIWQNAAPSSSQLFCPMRIGFIKGTSDITKGEFSYYKHKIAVKHTNIWFFNFTYSNKVSENLRHLSHKILVQ